MSEHRETLQHKHRSTPLFGGWPALGATVLLVLGQINSGGPALLYAQSPNDGQQEASEETPPAKRNGFIFLPIISYAPETKLALGVAVQYYFREGGSADDSRPSNLVPVLMFTTNKQIVAQLFFDTWWKNETYNVGGGLGFSRFPNKFWGIGNDTPDENEEDYTPQGPNFAINGQRRVYKSLNLGVNYEWFNSKMIEVEEGGLLDQGIIPGSEGGSVSGAGLFLNWDTRDNIFVARHGGFFLTSATFFGGFLGGDFDFSRYVFDLRQYFPAFSTHSIAVQGFLQVETGVPPFQMMSQLGGQNLMRGYFEGRYRDRNMLVFQAEYRIVPVWWRFGVAAFAGIGDVSRELSDFRLSEFKYSYGFGVRYLLSPDEGITLRFDFGFGEGSSGTYITFGEAF